MFCDWLYEPLAFRQRMYFPMHTCDQWSNETELHMMFESRLYKWPTGNVLKHVYHTIRPTIWLWRLSNDWDGQKPQHKLDNQHALLKVIRFSTLPSSFSSFWEMTPWTKLDILENQLAKFDSVKRFWSLRTSNIKRDIPIKRLRNNIR